MLTAASIQSDLNPNVNPRVDNKNLAFPVVVLRRHDEDRGLDLVDNRVECSDSIKKSTTVSCARFRRLDIRAASTASGKSWAYICTAACA